MAELSIRQQFHNIVVIGAMNPRLHSAFWYETIGAITREEFNSAVSDEQLVCSQPYARLRFANITVDCQADRWEVSSNLPSTLDRMAEVTALVFRKLNETPVSLIGFNSQLHVETPQKNVVPWLLGTLAPDRLGVPVANTNSCHLTCIRQMEDHKEVLSVGASPVSKDLMSVALNREFQPRAKEGERYFDVGNDLAERIRGNYGSAKDLAQSVLGKMLAGVKE